MTGPSRGKAIAYALALFLAGGICGAMVMARISTAAQSLKLGRTDEIAVKIREKLTTGLGLTPAQQDEFKPLINQAAGELEASHRDCLDRITTALILLHTKIAPKLNPDQKAKLAALENQRAGEMQQKYNYQLSGSGQTNHN
jgi:uncharacterized membrane protein